MNTKTAGFLVLLIGIVLLIVGIAMMLILKSNLSYILIIASVVVNVAGLSIMAYRKEDD